MENPTQKLHPMIIVAAVAVTLASLAAVASFTGYLPVAQGAAVAQSAQPAAPAPQAAATQPAAPVRHSAPRQTASRNQGGVDRTYNGGYESGNRPVNDSGIYAESRSNLCRDCGTVQSIREVKQEGEAGALGTIGGAAVGGLLGNQVGKGNGKTAATVVGAVGGAFAGREIEKHVRSTSQFEVVVRFDDGNTRSFSEQQQPAYRSGDRVRMSNGSLALM